MENGLEAHSEVADLVWVVLLDRLQQHANTFPIVLTKYRVIVGIESRSLRMRTTAPLIPQQFYVNSNWSSVRVRAIRIRGAKASTNIIITYKNLLHVHVSQKNIPDIFDCSLKTNN